MSAQIESILLFTHPSVQFFISGTSNWTKDYFLQTAGLAVIFESAGKVTPSKRKTKDVREKLVDVFLRDWNGPWAKELQMIKS